MSRARVSLAAAVVLAGAIGSAILQHAPFAASAGDQRFVGTWRLVSIETNGKPDPRQGAHPIGLIYYDASGHMAVQIAPDRSRPSWQPSVEPSLEQARDALKGYVAYFGTYSVDERASTVTHHREGSLNLYAIDLVRRYEFVPEGRLILTPLEDANARTRLVWERLR